MSAARMPGDGLHGGASCKGSGGGSTVHRGGTVGRLARAGCKQWLPPASRQARQDERARPARSFFVPLSILPEKSLSSCADIRVPLQCCTPCLAAISCAEASKTKRMRMLPRSMSDGMAICADVSRAGVPPHFVISHLRECLTRRRAPSLCQ
jgi:hypothetical protein